MMALLDIFFRRGKGPKPDADGMRVLGRDDAADNLDDDGLPSVNRRGRGRFGTALGLLAVLGGGLAAMYIMGGSAEKAQAPLARKEIRNNLPPLALPKPPPPPIEIAAQPQVPAPANQSVPQPIPLEKTQKPTAGKKAAPDWKQRKLHGDMLIEGERRQRQTAPGPRSAVAQEADESASGSSQDELSAKLKPTVTKAVQAKLLPNRNFLIAKGTTLDCALETAIDTTVPGITTCRLTRDVYSDNGHVVLLDRGSQLVGEYQGGIRHGQARIFVLWTRAKTPNGVVIALNSPGTDALGRSGHEGWVDTHFMERFGAAILLSMVKDAWAYARATQAEGGGTVVVGDGNTDRLSTEILKNTVMIPPTLYINQGEHIQVMAARDLDFATVYGLELKE